VKCVVVIMAGKDRHGKQGQKHIKGTRAGTALNDASSRCNSRGPITRFQNVKVFFTVNTHVKACLIEALWSPDYWQHAVRVAIIRDCLDNCIGKDRTHVSCIGTRNLPVKLLWSVGAPIQKLLGSFSGAARGTALNLQ